MLATNLKGAETKRKDLEQLVDGLSHQVAKLKKREALSGPSGDRASLSPSPDYVQVCVCVCVCVYVCVCVICSYCIP